MGSNVHVFAVCHGSYNNRAWIDVLLKPQCVFSVTERLGADWGSNAVRLSRLPVLMMLKIVVSTPAMPFTCFAYVTGFFLWSCSGWFLPAAE